MPVRFTSVVRVSSEVEVSPAVFLFVLVIIGGAKGDEKLFHY